LQSTIYYDLFSKKLFFKFKKQKVLDGKYFSLEKNENYLNNKNKE